MARILQCFVCIDQNLDDCSDVGNFVSFVNDDIGRLTEDIENIALALKS